MTATKNTSNLRISSFFKSPSKSPQKRHLPINSTLGDTNSEHELTSPRPAKRRKTQSSVEPEAPIYSPRKHMPLPLHTGNLLSTPKQQHKAPKRVSRREAFKKKLLVENNSFFLRDSSAPPPSVTETRESEGNSDDEFEDMMQEFSRKSKGKRRLTQKTRASESATVVSEEGTGRLLYTPLENQVKSLKEEHPGTLLMIEVGYKYRFFGEDARVASKELGIVCFMDKNLLTAFVPAQRRDIHLKKLLSQGYRVGMVRQIETAAIKRAGDTRNAPFVRKLTHLYTAATYVDELDSVDDFEKYTSAPLMCLIEKNMGGMGVDERVIISMVSISPSTGDVIWDEFCDTHMRIELEARMAHIKPSELLLPLDGLSKPTEKMLTHFAETVSTNHKFRSERFEECMSRTEALSFVSKFYTDKTRSRMASASFNSGRLMAAVTDFPQQVIIALAHAIKHLSAFDIADALLETNFFSKFTTREHMLLNGNTLANLEIYCNTTDFTTKGSLLWVLDHTQTKFGARLLRNWVGRPLVDKNILQNRVDAVEEIVSSSSEKLVTLRSLLSNVPDLARGLCRIQYGKCTPEELAVLLPAFNKMATAFAPVNSPEDVGFGSKLLNDIVFSFPLLKTPLHELLGSIFLKEAALGHKSSMWTDLDSHPAIIDHEMAIQAVQLELREELKFVRQTLQKPSLEWSTIAGEEFIIEVEKKENKKIPVTWFLLSSTKYLRRYHTPMVRTKIQELAQHRELLDAEAHKAFLSFLCQIIQNYYCLLRDAINKLAIADCLFSFAIVALQDGYVRPQFAESDLFEIDNGRHPIIEALRADPFIPNSCMMGGDEPRNKIITGPNMGGKSSFVRMVALIALMAQIGSYVPASSVKLGMIDGILTRMGASDDLIKGRSTFMVEMSETSEILRTATKKSLVILDELGRGTSTFDGMAIANAVMEHLISNTRCKTLFITHYPLVAMNLEKKFSDVENLHMGFTQENRIDGTRDITFLYRLTHGMAMESFGVECARLAGLPDTILSVALGRSISMRRQVEERIRRNRTRRCLHLLNGCLNGSDYIDELREIVDSTTRLFI